MTHYVVGFFIEGSIDNGLVVLIQKNRPAWQAGKMNGVGGKIEIGELPITAMVREFWEETGYTVEEGRWNKFAEIIDDNAYIHFYWAEAQNMPNGESELRMCQTNTDEAVVIRSINDITANNANYIHNLPWLLNMIPSLKVNGHSFYQVRCIE